MPTFSASTFLEAESLILKGEVKKIEILFNITTDEFFRLASRSFEQGGKVTYVDGKFNIFFERKN
ncbi:hypothetical protein [Pantoea ananatis]|uniref:hypothetical protein n=1 Tax=Pantoea ananas TaxID=553 RepID=UPI000CF49895|nr:hypothetical protein [Pantoea ananatis]PQK93416.1 hypothetical protein CG433_11970 [Pantoea ananatis]